MRLVLRALVPVAVVIGIASSSCLTPATPPQYMQDTAKTSDGSKVALSEIRKELGDDFLCEQIHDIFFVAGNDGRWGFDNCKGTISRVYTFLTTTYFETKPSKPIRCYLFKDKDSYDAYVKQTYGKEPTTPYGFYMSGERKMVMNIATGTGTLAHELVHPLLAEDFPAVPAWFNEGFASLFEQSNTNREGKIVGLVNWRLPGLQRAITKGGDVPLEKLLKTNLAQFYGDNTGVNYATARYLCYWLQEKDLLLKFYKEFKATLKDDATGQLALEKVTEMKIADLDKLWREFVQKLEYRR